MASITIKKGTASKFKSKTNNAISKNKEAIRKLKTAIGLLSTMDFESKSSFVSSLESYVSELTKQNEQLQGYITLTNTVENDFYGIDNSLKNNEKSFLISKIQTISSNISSRIKINNTTISRITSLFISKSFPIAIPAVIIKRIKDIIAGRNTTSTSTSSSGETHSGSGAHIGTEETTNNESNVTVEKNAVGTITTDENGVKHWSNDLDEKYKVVNNTYYRDSHTRRNFYDEDGGTVNTYVYNSESNKTGSCTDYALTRIQENGGGLLFKAKGGTGNGRQIVDNLSDCYPKTSGNDCLQEMYNQYGDCENLLVSLEPCQGNNSAGHVVVIDKMWKDDDGVIRLIYSDQSHSPKEYTLDSFKFKMLNNDGYYHYSSIKGAALIGK